MEIPKAKIFIYALTFLGYAYSGHGAGMINNLKDAVLAAESVFGDVLQNVVSVVRKFKDVNDVFGAAVEENCQFSCPDGAKAVINKYHKPSSNGCGSLGLEISKQNLPVAAMTTCCDEHDICYDTCNSDKEKCDFDFKRCLYKLCDQIDKSAGETIVIACKTGAKMLFTGTLTLGCKSFMEAQKAACHCPVSNNNRNNKKKSRYHQGGEL